MKRVIGWFICYLCRWLPHRSETGLQAVGNPDEQSPVIVTANFSLTVKRVRRALEGRDVWLLVAGTEGINVWCAACGDAFTHHRVIDAIKVSGLADRVRHREVILPALSAPGMDRAVIRKETGFRARFGPVRAEDIPAYLDAGKKKTEAMCRFRFDLRHRADMFLSMNFPMWAAMAAVLALVQPRYLPGATALFWGGLAVLYLLVNVIPGRTGWMQAMVAATAFVLVWAGIDAVAFGDPLHHWGWFLATFAILFMGGFDLAGIATPRTSDAETFLHGLGLRSLGSIFRAKSQGKISLDRERCQGCGVCRTICPVGVFDDLDPENKTRFKDRSACFSCGACVKQCPEQALRLVRGAPPSTGRIPS